MRVGVPTELTDDETRVAVTPAGVTAFKAHGHSVLVKAKGPLLGPPPLPLVLDDKITLQWHNSTTGKCWGAEFSEARKNTDKAFIARSD